jgi:hypothetical protein
MSQDEAPTILFIPAAWVEWAVDLHARTGQPVCLAFYPTKIDRRVHERRQMEEVIERGVQRREAGRRASLLDLLEPANVQDRAA